MKRCILYARVSTEEQARSGYSLGQQIEALKGWAKAEGYEIVGEVQDGGHSGASLERPGLDHVRDLVSAGGVDAVLTQDRDRFSREPAYRFLLEKEFAEKGTRIRSLNDRGDDSPEGQLTDAIMDQLARYERAKTAERSRRGKVQKVRQGKIVAGHTANYGFAFNEDRDGYVIREDHMAVVRRIMHMVAEGTSIYSVKKTLEDEGVPTPPKPKQPEGGRRWSKRTIRDIVLDDLYRPLAHEEIGVLVGRQVAATLDPEKEYGIWFFNRRRTTFTPVSEVGPDGQRVYKKRQKTIEKPREEWIGVPIRLSGSGLSRTVVDEARDRIKDNVPTPKTGDRLMELRGVLYCGSCGSRMVANRVLQPRSKKPAYYYRCPTRQHEGKDACPDGKHHRAEKVEEKVWEAVMALRTTPDALIDALDRMIAEERNRHGDPERETRALADALSDLDGQRRRAQDLAIKGLLDPDELRARLAGMDEDRRALEHRMASLRDRKGEVAYLELLKADYLGMYGWAETERLAEATGEQRHEEYRRLRLRAEADGDGDVRLTWPVSIVSEEPSPR